MKTYREYLATNDGDAGKAEIEMWVELNREINLPSGKPATLENIAAGQGRAARKARKHIKDGYDPQCQLDNVTGQWKQEATL